MLVSVVAILLWIRELTRARQDDLAVRYCLGEILPPSVRHRHATMVVRRKTMLHTCSDEQDVWPNLVQTGEWAVRVPRIAIDVP